MALVFIALVFIVMNGQDRATHGAVGPITVVVTIDTNKARLFKEQSNSVRSFYRTGLPRLFRHCHDGFLTAFGQGEGAQCPDKAAENSPAD